MAKKKTAVKTKVAKAVESLQPVTLKLDLGCGKNKQPGFIGVDVRPFEGVDWVCDLGSAPWIFTPNKKYPSGQPALCEPQLDNSVDAIHCSHFVEHLTAPQRIAFVNELYRVLKPGAQATIITPHWASVRAYGDLTHQWPPVCEMWFNYLLKSWRDSQAPHNDAYTCDFDITWGYSMRQDLMSRNQEYQVYALQNFKDAAQDIIATFTKRKHDG